MEMEIDLTSCRKTFTLRVVESHLGSKKYRAKPTREFTDEETPQSDMSPRYHHRLRWNLVRKAWSRPYEGV